MSIEKILIVDDDSNIRDFLMESLHSKGFDITPAESGQKALKLLQETSFDMVITDLRMSDISGIEVLRKTKELHPSTIVVIITAFGSIENSVEAMRLGAFTYIPKPFSADAIEAVIEKARDHISLVEENHYLRHQIATGGSRTARKVIAESPQMKQILAEAEQIAKSNANVFISGESGTGKEVIAHAIHHQSPRANRPFIKVNCAAVPETLIESEFFGHEKGAFTGANLKRIGRFELAHGGSLLLDEVTEIPLALQAKLLRAIQEQEFERVGGIKPVNVDIRVISTTNRNVQEALEQQVLRKDLYYRLNVVPLHLPPLRERKEDIIPLAEYFLEKICFDNQKSLRKLSKDAKRLLQEYPWPGNIRELANIIERTVVLDRDEEVQSCHLRLDSLNVGNGNSRSCSETLPVGMSLQELEKQMIIETLQRHENDRAKAAETLGISVRTLRNKLQSYQ